MIVSMSMVREQDEVNSDPLIKYNKIKNLKLLSAIIIDLAGMASYFFPVVGGSVDLAWGPVSGVLISLLFHNHKKMAFLLGVSEEVLPFTDFIPTALLAWRLDYVTDKERTLAEFWKKEGCEALR